MFQPGQVPRAVRPRLLVLTRIIPRRLSWVDVGVVLFVGLLIYGLVGVASEWRAPLREAVSIDLSFWALPRYTFFSLCRGIAAFVLSFSFTLAYGYAAARVRRADKVMLPLLDILQSIRVLGFMPGVVLALVSLFPRSNVGLELAAVLMMFTGQVWNMTFSFYHSLRAVPGELMDAARIYRFSAWRRLKRVELPFAATGLVWNGMMSMAGGWFFLTINEAFRLGDKDFRLPGIGAYMSVAIDKGDVGAMAAAVIAMVAMIVVVDQFFWRPLVARSDRFKFEEVGGGTPPTSWVLDLLRRSGLVAWLSELVGSDQKDAGAPNSRGAGVRAASEAGPSTMASGRPKGQVLGWIVLAAFAGACIWGTIRLTQLLATLRAPQWGEIGSDAMWTLLRTTIAVVLGSLWTIPLGIYIGTHPRAARVLQPVVQIAASFPAPMLFPVVLFVLTRVHVGLGVGAIVLMMLGTQWYILFNVIAGAMSIPHDLHEAAVVFRFPPLQRWKRLLLPGVFPQLVTGWVTAAGGAWNASIVSEYVQAAGRIERTRGLGALISTSASGGQFALLAASVVTMALLVVAINRTFWKSLYHMAERRFSLGR
jgi:NitT/TauT family transport system permease protein